jgi:hypothetical protein
MADWWRSPLLHFLLAGALLFAADRGWESYAVARDRLSPYAPIVFSAERVAAMRAAFTARWGTAPDGAALDGMIRQAADDDMLYREARRLGLDRQDGSVRLRLIQKARAVSVLPQDDEALYREASRLGLDDDIVVRGILRHKMLLLLRQDSEPRPPSDGEIAAYLEAHRARFAIPASVSFSQVFLSARTHGAHLADDALALLERLRSASLPPGRAAPLSDPFPFGSDLHGQSRDRLAQLFGAEFAARLFDLPPNGWSGPIPSPYGLHLVWVSARAAEAMPALDTVRRQVAREIAEQQAERQLAGELARLRLLYPVLIMAGDPRTAGATAAVRP